MYFFCDKHKLFGVKHCLIFKIQLKVCAISNFFVSFFKVRFNHIKLVLKNVLFRNGAEMKRLVSVLYQIFSNESRPYFQIKIIEYCVIKEHGY